MDSSTKLEKTKLLADKFRSAIEHCKDDLPVPFHNFPKGSCSPVALLFGTFLKDNGMGEFDYLSGARWQQPGEMETHAWIMQGDLLIDITADQFPEINEKVFLTRDMSWHKKFEIMHQYLADYRQEEPKLDSTYKKILSVLKQNR